MESRQRSWLLILAAVLVASCVPPPVESATATIAIETRDDGEMLGVAFRSFAKEHGMIVAEAEIPTEGRPIRRRDAVGMGMQLYSSNAVSRNITIVRFYRGGVTFKIAPAPRSEVMSFAREYCRTATNDPSTITIRAAKGALMLDELPAETGCSFLN